MILDFNKLTNIQQEYIAKYAAIHDKLGSLQDEMDIIQSRIADTIKELEQIREEENKTFEHGQKEE